MLSAGAAAGAHGQAPLPEPRRVDGVVMHGEPKGPRPIGGVRVVLHRVGQDRAGPLDSALTDNRGQYHFRYRPSGSPDAVYFVSASYDGIAYFSTPLGAASRGDDAQITVFDTTSAPVPIHVLGHHIILGTPNADGRREVVEVFELGNDSSVTRVSGGRERPVWSTPLPRGAADAKINPTGEISPSAITFTNGIVRLFAPISPGARQVSYAYELPKSALPASIALGEPTSVLEVLLEEQAATVSGGNLSEVAPTSTAGRTFRRFLAQNVPQTSVIRIDVPFVLGAARSRYFIAVAVVCALSMLGAVVVAARRRPAVVPRAPAQPADALLHAIATLDARYERESAPSEATRANYEAERARLKTQLAAVLAGETPAR